MNCSTAGYHRDCYGFTAVLKFMGYGEARCGVHNLPGADYIQASQNCRGSQVSREPGYGVQGDVEECKFKVGCSKWDLEGDLPATRYHVKEHIPYEWGGTPGHSFFSLNLTILI